MIGCSYAFVRAFLRGQLDAIHAKRAEVEPPGCQLFHVDDILELVAKRNRERKSQVPPGYVLTKNLKVGVSHQVIGDWIRDEVVDGKKVFIGGRWVLCVDEAQVRRVIATPPERKIPMRKPIPEGFMKTSDVTKLCGIGKDTLRGWRETESVEAVKIGNTFYFNVSDVECHLRGRGRL